MGVCIFIFIIIHLCKTEVGSLRKLSVIMWRAEGLEDARRGFALYRMRDDARYLLLLYNKEQYDIGIRGLLLSEPLDDVLNLLTWLVTTSDVPCDGGSTL
jgi:hypothetical protein